jgi:hypothetical protein
MEVVKRGSGRVGKDVIGRSEMMINGVWMMCRWCIERMKRYGSGLGDVPGGGVVGEKWVWLDKTVQRLANHASAGLRME